MDPDVVRLLELPSVLGILASLTSTATGRELALALEPMDDAGRVALALSETAELIEASRREFSASLGGTPDVRAPVQRAAAGGGPLEGPVLWQIASMCEAAERVKGALERLGERYPSLLAIGARVPPCAELARQIKAAIDPSGAVKDDAGPRLASMRRKIQSLRRRIEGALESLTRRRDVRPHLQYPNPRFWRGRYVLPVNARQRGHVRGIVHGTSDSGATLYVEPLSVVGFGNQLTEAQGAEEEEVRAILWELTRAVARDSRSLLAAQRELALVDLIQAKARMAARYQMSRPVVTPAGALELEGARHPILLSLTENVEAEDPARREPDFEPVVPIDLHLGGDFRVLVVTGPNTGGKTVTLKTVGLLCLMARAGLYVPAERAVIPLHDGLWADIGDEQSLQQSLSTFSSHVSRIVRILNSAGEASLVLLDELGAGTDPTEGASLAQAILTELVGRGCQAIVTTHLGSLKTFASTCPDAENACVEFDASTLRPTYRLSIGMAGRSNAIEIADRLGMPQRLLAEARRQLDTLTDGRYGGMIEQINQAACDIEERRRRARWLEEESLRLKEQHEDILRRLKDEEERTGADLGLKLRKDLQQLAGEADRLYDDVQFSHRAAARQARQIADGLRSVLARTDRLLEGRAPERPIEPGDEVYVVRVHKWARVDRVDAERSRATVTAGNVQMEVDLDDLLPWGSDMGA